MSSVPATFELGWFWSTEARATSFGRNPACVKSAHHNINREFPRTHGGANRLTHSSGGCSPPFGGYQARSIGPRLTIGLEIL